jgi:predicted transcriptional regulator
MHRETWKNLSTDRFRWMAEPEWMTATEIATRYGLTQATLRVTISEECAHHAGVWKGSARL